jgi:uncharacterized oxidoreductase
MKTSGNTILITGGATGIGLALAEAFLQAGNEVLVCGRRAEKLEQARLLLPALHTLQCDVADAEKRQALFDWATSQFPSLNVLVNNAGIQQQIDLRAGADSLLNVEDEIEINLTAPIHLSALFIPQLARQAEAAIINISSGLGFVPLAFMPVYCATKAALHSFSLSMRRQLRDTPVKVFEIIPPTTDTELDRGARSRREQADRGIPPGEVAQATLQALAADEYELAVGRAQGLRMAARNEPEQFFERMNGG